MYKWEQERVYWQSITIRQDVYDSLFEVVESLFSSFGGFLFSRSLSKIGTVLLVYYNGESNREMVSRALKECEGVFVQNMPCVDLIPVNM